MLIRTAKPEDISHIRNLSLQSTVNRDSQEPIGFVEYQTPSEEEYQKRIEGNPFFYVAEVGENFAGFYSAYTKEHLQKLSTQDPIVSHIFNKTTGTFIYAEELAVPTHLRKRGVGDRLFKQLFCDAPQYGYNDIFGAAAHSPKRSNIGIRIIIKNRFEPIEEISFDGMVFGIYKKTL